MEAVRFDNVKYSYREDEDTFAVNGVTLSIEQGEFVAVLGLIWINFLLEILIDVLLAPALYRVVSAVERTLGRKRSGGAPSAVEKAEKKENPDEENAGTWDITE